MHRPLHFYQLLWQLHKVTIDISPKRITRLYLVIVDEIENKHQSLLQRVFRSDGSRSLLLLSDVLHRSNASIRRSCQTLVWCCFPGFLKEASANACNKIYNNNNNKPICNAPYASVTDPEAQIAKAAATYCCSDTTTSHTGAQTL